MDTRIFSIVTGLLILLAGVFLTRQFRLNADSLQPITASQDDIEPVQLLEPLEFRDRTSEQRKFAFNKGDYVELHGILMSGSEISSRLTIHVRLPERAVFMFQWTPYTRTLPGEILFGGTIKDYMYVQGKFAVILEEGEIIDYRPFSAQELDQAFQNGDMK